VGIDPPCGCLGKAAGSGIEGVDVTVESVQLLWTGGWDSTFRLCELALIERKQVQPIYLLDERGSQQLEIKTMRKLRIQLDERGAAGLILPTTIFDARAHGPSPDLQRCWDRLLAKYGKLGGQYLKLAYMGDLLDWRDIEVSWARGEVNEALVRALFLDPDVDAKTHEMTNTDEGWLFRRFRFPTLRYTKGDMREISEQMGFLDLLQRTWFCQAPVRGRPCGECRPCQLAPQTGEKVHRVSRTELRARATAKKARRMARGLARKVNRVVIRRYWGDTRTK